ncbi:uncharacterized protein BT62DRAFT_884572, partial [Guyanagaster necrorhizus]
GYVDGTILCMPTAQVTTGTTLTTTPLPLDSTPSYDEWKFCDSHVCSHIILNVSDSIGLGFKVMKTVKEAWDSIIDTYTVQNNMALSEAQQILQNIKYTEGTNMNAHIQNLFMKYTAVDNLSETRQELTDKDFRGIIICSFSQWKLTLNCIFSIPVQDVS